MRKGKNEVASALGAALAMARAHAGNPDGFAAAIDRLNAVTNDMDPEQLREVATAARRLADHCEWLLSQ
jgi:hypothetical protein